MREKKCSWHLICYELRNLNGNLMSHFFGIVFSNLMSLFLSKAVGSQVPEAMRQEAVTSIMLSMSLIMPMSIMLLGYGALYSQEVEREIPMRMKLFGFREGSVMLAKIIAHLIFLTVAMVIFALFHILVMDVQRPAPGPLICMILSLYVLGILFLVISHAIANMLRRFSLTFGVEMILYFLFMVLGGMMGVRLDQLPKVLQSIAKVIPMTYISNDFCDFWQGGTYHFMPYIQSLIFFGSVAGILLLVSLWKDRRRI